MRAEDASRVGTVDRKYCSGRYSEVDWMAPQGNECYERWCQGIHRRDLVALASGGQKVC